MPYREFLGTRFYKEWARRQGIVDFVSAVLDKSVTSAALFGVFRYERDGIVDDEARRRMRLIVPHIRRAVLVDGLNAGMFLVDAAGRIVHTNPTGQAIIGASDFLSAVDGRLVASDEKINQILRQLFAAAGGGDAAVETQGTARPLRALDGMRYVAHVLPLTSGDRRVAGTAYAATGALFVRKAAIEAHLLRKSSCAPTI
jgi:PAS domain-containing protein